MAEQKKTEDFILRSPRGADVMIFASEQRARQYLDTRPAGKELTVKIIRRIVIEEELAA